jgi:hypothetical protein
LLAIERISRENPVVSVLDDFSDRLDEFLVGQKRNPIVYIGSPFTWQFSY